MRIIEGTITNGVTIATGDSPVLIGGVITNDGTGANIAVYGGAGVYADIRNAGTIGDIDTFVGINLLSAGTITNGAPAGPHAMIVASGYGLKLAAASTITNYGSITGVFAGARVLGAGEITNGSAADTAALIGGSTGEGLSLGEFGGTGVGTVVNFGTVSSAKFSGVDLGTNSGGQITNGSTADTAALISGYGEGIRMLGGPGTVSNFGTITETSATGLGILGDSIASVYVTNGSSTSTKALISGGRYGIDAGASSNVITNFATITGTGTGGEALDLGGGTVVNGAPTSTAALLQGDFVGVYLSGTGQVTNYAKIEGGGVGILLTAGGTLVNGSASDTTALIGNGIDGIDVSGAAATTVTNFGTIAGVDSSILLGGGADKLIVEPGAKFIGSVDGGAGTDTVTFVAGGTLAVGNFSGFEDYVLSSASADTLTLTNANFADATGSAITVDGGSAGNTVNAAALTGLNAVTLVGGAGKDVFTGGAGNDFFDFSAANLAATDTAVGNGGTDHLIMTTAGTVNAAGVSGVEIYDLANGGADTLTLTNANFAGVTGSKITVNGGSGGNAINAAALTGSNQVSLVGGAGNDVFTAGQHAAMTGGAGADTFIFTTPGTLAAPDTNTIADFTHATDKVDFSDAGFSLGLSGASSTPQALPSTLFTSDSTGSFTAAAQRFAYNTSTGALYYDSQGNTAGSTRLLVATLTGHPTLATSDLFFTT